MENLGLLIYWITRLDSIKAIMFLIFVSIVMYIAYLLIMWIFSDDECSQEERNKLNKTIKNIRLPIIIGIFVSILSLVFIPSTKEAFVMTIIPQLTKNEKLMAIPDKTLTLFNSYLDKWIKEVNPIENLPKKEDTKEVK